MAGADRSWKANALIHEGRRRKGIEAETSKKRKEMETELELVSILQDAKMASCVGRGLEGLWRWHSMQDKNLPKTSKKHLAETFLPPETCQISITASNR